MEVFEKRVKLMLARPRHAWASWHVDSQAAQSRPGHEQQEAFDRDLPRGEIVQSLADQIGAGQTCIAVRFSFLGS